MSGFGIHNGKARNKIERFLTILIVKGLENKVLKGNCVTVYKA